MYKQRYVSPKIESKKIKINFFSNYGNRNGYNNFSFVQEVYADTIFIPKACKEDEACCFPYDAMIALHNGTSKPIYKIRHDDEILSYDPNLKMMVPSQVESLLQYHNTKLDTIIINNKLPITKNHPIWARSKPWKQAGDLTLKDELFTTGEKLESVDKITYTNVKPSRIYNILLKGDLHNFFVNDCLVYTGHRLTPVFTWD